MRLVLLMMWLQASSSNALDAFPLGIISPFTCVSQDYLGCSSLFDLDMRKYSEPDLIQRFGPPILNLTNVHPDLKITSQAGTTDCSPDVAVREALTMIQGDSPIIGLVGGLLSSGVTAVAPISTVFQVPQVTFGGAAASLGDRVLYPYLVRVLPPSSFAGRAMWAWIEEFNVPSATILYSQEGLGEGVFTATLEQANQVERASSVTGAALAVLDEDNVDWNAVDEACDAIRSVGSRFILLAISSASMATLIMGGMERKEMLYGLYQILATAGANYVEGAALGPSQGRPLGFQKVDAVPRGKLYPQAREMWQKMVPDDVYSEEARQRLGLDSADVNASNSARPLLTEEVFDGEFNLYCGFLLDAAFTFAVAINNLLNAGVAKDRIQGSVLLEGLKNVEFEGVTGLVAYDSNSDRASDFELINQLEIWGELVPMARWRTSTGEWSYLSGEKQLMWANGTLSGNAPTELVACEPGQRRDDGNGYGFCQPCPRNWYSTGASDEGCHPCGAGWVGSQEFGAASCHACNNGSYREIGDETCAPCRSGTFGDGAGLSACTSCPVGQYTPDSGYSECIACGAGQASEEFFTTFESVLVKGVPAWGYKLGASSNRSCGCDINFRRDGADECVPCTSGMICSGMSDVVIKPGYYAESISSNGELIVFKCHGDDLRCIGGLPGQTCAAGRTGVTCAECQEGKTSGASGTCVACEGSDGGPFITVVTLFVACLTVLYRYIDKTSRATQSTAALLFGIVLGLLVSVVQQLGVMANVSVQWEEPVKSLLASLSVLTLDVEVLRLNCISSHGPAERFLLRVLFIFVSIAIMVFIHIAYVMVLHHGQFRKRMHSLVGSIGSVFIIFYIAVTATVLQPLQCEAHPRPNPERTLSAYPGVICWESGEHTEMLFVGIFAFIAVPVAFLASIVYVVMQYPSRMRAGDAWFMQSFAFLFFRFRPSCYFFVVILMLRSFCVACVLVVPDTVVQLFTLQLVLLVGFAASLYLFPWRVAFANVLDCFAGGCVLLFVSMASLLLEDDQKDMKGIAWLSACLIFIMIGMLPPTMIWAVYVKFFRVSKPFQFFLCHHKSASGAYTRLLKMNLTEHSKVSSGVFVDSDNLDSLDRLFDYVGNDTLNLVVLCTQQIFTRPWCVGEMCSAHIKKVYTVLVGMPTCELPDDYFIASFAHRVEDLDVLLGNGLNLDLITGALRWIRHQPIINVPDVVNEHIMSSLASALVMRSHTAITEEQGTIAATQHGCYMLFDTSNMEAAATACVLRKMLLPLLATHMEKVPEPMCTDVDCSSIDTMVVMCTNGIFEQADVAVILSRLPQPLPNLLPVLADSGFSFPQPDTNDYGSTVSPDSLQNVATVIQQLFKSIAITFVAQIAGDASLRLAAQQVVDRLTVGKRNDGSLPHIATVALNAELVSTKQPAEHVEFEVWA